MTESARMFLEELVLSVREWGGYAPGCTMLEADLTAESLVGLLGPPDAEQKIGEMHDTRMENVNFTSHLPIKPSL